MSETIRRETKWRRCSVAPSYSTEKIRENCFIVPPAAPLLEKVHAIQAHATPPSICVSTTASVVLSFLQSPGLSTTDDLPDISPRNWLHQRDDIASILVIELRQESLSTSCVEVTRASSDEDASLTLRIGCSSSSSSDAVKKARIADGLTDVATRLYNIDAVSYSSQCGYRHLDKLLLQAMCFFGNVPYPYPSPVTDINADPNVVTLDDAEERLLLDMILRSRQEIAEMDGDFEFSMKIRQHIKDMYSAVLQTLSDGDEAGMIDPDELLSLKDINKLLHVYRYGLKHLQQEMCGMSGGIMQSGSCDSGLEDALFTCLQATLQLHQAPLDAVLVHVDGSGAYHGIPGIAHIVTQALERFDAYSCRISSYGVRSETVLREHISEVTHIVGSSENLARRTQSLDNVYKSQDSSCVATMTTTKASRRSSTSQLNSSDFVVLSPRFSSPQLTYHKSEGSPLLQPTTLFVHIPVQAVDHGCCVLLDAANAGGNIRVVEHAPSIGIRVVPKQLILNNDNKQKTCRNVFWLNNARNIPAVAVSKHKMPVNDELLFFSELIMHYRDPTALHQLVIKYVKDEGWSLCFVMPVLFTKTLCQDNTIAKSSNAEAPHEEEYSLEFVVRNYDVSDDTEYHLIAAIELCPEKSNAMTYYVVHIHSECGLVGASLTRCDYLPQKQLTVTSREETDMRTSNYKDEEQFILNIAKRMIVWRYWIIGALVALLAIIVSYYYVRLPRK